jgi:hypothetical protein
MWACEYALFWGMARKDNIFWADCVCSMKQGVVRLQELFKPRKQHVYHRFSTQHDVTSGKASRLPLSVQMTGICYVCAAACFPGMPRLGAS